jgi:hypothetical protein
MAGENRKHVLELEILRKKLNHAEHKKDYPTVVEACLEIIELDTRVKALNIMACLYYKDLGEAYLRLLEYQKAVDSLNTARKGLMEWRATKKLKFPDDWLNELKAIDRLIVRIERTHLD